MIIQRSGTGGTTTTPITYCAIATSFNNLTLKFGYSCVLIFCTKFFHFFLKQSGNNPQMFHQVDSCQCPCGSSAASEQLDVADLPLPFQLNNSRAAAATYHPVLVLIDSREEKATAQLANGEYAGQKGTN